MTNPNEIAKIASSCVKCGMCLPYCPTYSITRDENRSPRGRIALIEAIATEKIAINSELTQHLDSCLGCLKCEKMCPAEVEYSKLLSFSRQQSAYINDIWHYPATAGITFSLAIINKLCSNIKLLKSCARISHALMRMKLIHSFSSYLATKSSKAKLITSYLQALKSPAKLKATYPPQESVACKKIGLFIGCINQVVTPELISNSIKILNHCGFEVMIPPQQNCCGAVANNCGNNQLNHKLLNNNLKIFNQTNVSHIVTIASGCEQHLQQLQNMGLTAKICDINQFVLDNLPAKTTFKEIAQTVAIHTPCSFGTASKNNHTLFKLLNLIPKIKLIFINQQNLCCGGAGTYPLTNPKTSQQLLESFVKECQNIDANYIITANISCYLQLLTAKNYLPHKNVTHCINLLANSLQLN